MSRWFRFYDETINDPKVLRLSDKMFRVWTGMLCLASKYGGHIPKEDIAIALRLTEAEADEIVRDLIARVFLVDCGETVTPHNWNGRQYKSDVSTDRVKRFRKQQRNVSETPPDTDTDTESDTEQKEGATAPRPVKKDRKRATQFPEALAANRAAQEAAGLSEPEGSREFEKFRNHARERGRTCVDWAAAERNWYLKAAEFMGRKPKPLLVEKPPDWDSLVAFYVKLGRWHHSLGPDPSSPACRVPREILEKHGFKEAA